MFTINLPMMRTTPRSPWLAVSVALVVGFLATRGWVAVLDNDLLHRWNKIPSPPLADVSLLTIWQTTLYMQAPSGEVLAIDPDRDAVWTRHAPLPTSDPPLSYRDYLGPCDTTDARFRWSAAPPAAILECLEAHTRISVGLFTLSVIRDTHNQLWYFQTGGSDFFLDGMMSVILCFIATTALGYGVTRVVLG